MLELAASATVSLRRDFKELLAEAETQGWTVKRTARGHYQLLAPDAKTIVVIAGTPGDRRALIITVSRMRRYGFRWKGR